MPYTVPMLRTINVDRYVLPLREGGSVPGLVDADDGRQYVIKFQGAAQGPKVLIAELIGGEIARALGLNVPDLVFARLDGVFGRTESDEEIQSQLKASVGLNIGVGYLPGSVTYDPAVRKIDAQQASGIVWLDCLITNVDRTARNTNMLVWNNKLWLIDHGSSLFFHFRWDDQPEKQALRPFGRVKEHVLLPYASRLDKVNRESRAILTQQVIRDIVSIIPDDWLIVDSPFHSAMQHRQAYEQFLLSRIANSDIFVKEAKYARKEIV